MECANCYIPNREIPDMDKDKLFEFVSKLPKRTFVRLIGAEATMRDDLFEIISEVKNLGHRVSSYNKWFQTPEEYVVKLKEAGLRLVLLSMNGATDDDVYKILDSGKYATLKHRALKNLLKHKFIGPNTGTIIAKGAHEKTIKEQVDSMCPLC